MLGQQGGRNRIKILELLKDRPYNLNQLSTELDLNYRTIKHHVEILLEHDLIKVSGEGYGKVYFLSPKLEENYEILEEMKKKYETLSKPPKLYEKVVKQTHEGIIILDEDKDVIFLNKSAEKITGYEDEELLGKNINELIGPDIQQSFEQVLSTEDYTKEVMRLKTKSGEKKTVSITLDHLTFNSGEEKIYSILMRDITEQTNQKEILDVLIENSEIMMAYMDSEFDILYANSAYAEKTDHTLEELIGKNHFELFPNEKIKELFEDVVEDGGKRTVINRSLFSSDSSEQDVEQREGNWIIEPLQDSEDKVKGLILSQWERS